MIAALAGFIFAIGLAISGMTQPSKVIGFLDVTGDWDPSLAFVMGGAIAVHFYFAQKAKRGGKPIFAEEYDLPQKTNIDIRLIVGAALFGVGWGLGGYCPGPAVVSLVTGQLEVIAFVLAMAAGMFAVSFIARSSARVTNRD